MNECRRGWARRFSASPLIVAGLFYGLIGAWEFYLGRDRLNPDGISYLRNAIYFVQGEWSLGVSGYWSPLISWSTAPLLALDVDPTYAMRGVLFVAGFALLWACHRMMVNLSSNLGWSHGLILCAIALDAARQLSWGITPDLLLAALLMAYVSLVHGEQIATHRRQQWLAGVLAGSAYLAKSFALPFFLVHYTAVVWMTSFKPRPSSSSECSPSSSLFGMWFRGMIGFALVASPWIVALSAKYDRLVFSKNAPIAHAFAGPADKDRDHLWHRQLHPVPPGRITVWETPETQAYAYWSPFESREYFVHQVRNSVRIAFSILRSVGSYDLLHFTIPALLVPVCMTADAWRKRRWDALFILMTLTVYAFGYILLTWEERYTRPFFFPLCSLASFQFASDWLRWQGNHRGESADRPSGKSNSRVATWGTLCVALSYLFATSYMTVEYLRELTSDRTTPRALARQLEESQVSGPLATLSESIAADGLAIAFHWGEPYLGTANDLDTRRIESRLTELGVRYLLVPDSRESGDYLAVARWKEITSITLPDGRPCKVLGP